MAPADLTLLRQWTQRNNPEAFETLASRYSGMVFATCTRILGNPTQAEDVTQECFETLATIDTIPRGHLGAWLHRVATNRAIDRIRREKRRQAREERYVAERGTSTEIRWDDIYEHVDQAIAELPDRVREPIVAHYLEGRTHAQIAEALGISRQAVTRRIGRGIEKIRGTLRRRGIPVAGAALAAMLTANASQAAPIPASLQTALGRIAVAGYQGAAVAGATGAMASALGGLLTAKTAIIGVVVVAVAGIATWTVTHRAETGTQPPVASAKESATPAASSETTPSEPVLAERSGTGNMRMASAATTASGDASAGAAVAETEGGVITGRIYDADSGEGLPGLRPYAVPVGTGSSVGNTEESDASGHYRITGLPRDTYRVSPSRPKDYPQMNLNLQSMTVTLPENQTVEGIDFALDKGMPISGRVVDAKGTPVGGAKVAGRASAWWGAESTQSRNDGTFTIPAGQACNDLMVQAGTDDFESEVLGPLTVTEKGLAGLELQLTKPKTASIAGSVVDAKGRPVAKAHIHLERGQEDYLVGSGRTETAANGAFCVENVAAGEYGILVTPPEQTTFNKDDEVMRVTLKEGQALTGLRLVLGADKGGLAIAGRVVDTSGKPVDNVQVSTFGPVRETAESGKDGTFLITGLREGVYSLSAHRARREWSDPQYSSVSVQNVRAGTMDVEIILQGVGAVEGRVLRADTGEPFTDFELFVSNGGADRFSSRLLMNGQQVKHPEGRFSREIYVGPVTVTARAPGYAPAFQTVEVLEHKTTGGIELRLKPASAVAGTVVNQRGEPVAGARVFLGRMAELFNLEDPAAESGADGTFVIEAFPPDIQELSAVHPEYAPGIAAVTDETTIVLPDGGVLEGTVTTGGKPCPDVPVEVSYIDESSGKIRASFIKTSADGGYRIAALAPGTVNVTAGTHGQRQASREAVVESDATTRVDLAFTPGTSTVQGGINVGQHTPRMIKVQCKVTTGAGIENFSVDADEDGMYRIENLPAGHVRLAVHMTSESAALNQFIEFDLAENEIVEQDFAFSAAGRLSGRIKGFKADLFGAVIVLDGEIAVPEDAGPEFFVRMQQSYAFSQTQCDESGAYTIEGLTEGTYTVLAVTVPRNADDNLKQVRAASAIVEIEKDAAVVLDFDLP